MSSLWVCMIFVILITGLLDEAEAGYGCPRKPSACKSHCQNKLKYVTGYCRGTTCKCSNHCKRRGARPYMCGQTCRRKGYRNWVCHHRNNLCYCGYH